MCAPVVSSLTSECNSLDSISTKTSEHLGPAGKRKRGRLALVVRLAIFVVLSGAGVVAQEIGKLREVGFTSTNTVRLIIESTLPTPGNLLLESADSPAGPWWKEPDFQTRAVQNGFEYITPFKSFYSHRFYRFRIFLQPASSVPAPPLIRFIAPNTDVRPGQSVSLLGANFGATPDANTVTFSSLTKSWKAPVTLSTSNLLVVTVPADLETETSSPGLLYRVTAATSQGEGNGVGCSVLKTTVNAFKARPSEGYILQPPGSGKQTFVVGGGAPPYKLVPQSTNDLKTAVASLDGSVLTVSAVPGVRFGFVSVSIQDSSTPFPQNTYVNVTVLTTTFSPTFDASFHTLLPGSAPGLTLLVQAVPSAQNLRVEQIESHLQNASIETSRLRPGDLLGWLRIFYSSDTYDFEQLTVTEVSGGRAKFDVLSLGDGEVKTMAQGELIENPPTIVINVLNLPAMSLARQPVHQELIFADDVFRLPNSANQTVSLTTKFTSVSMREDTYLPQTKTGSRTFTTTTLAPAAPRIDRLLPVQGEIFRTVRLRGSGFGATPADNIVTFTGLEAARVRAEILSQTKDELVVIVPHDAITGPVRLTVGGKDSNDFLFYVRFHVDGALTFDSFQADTPTAPRLMHQQVVDDRETTGEIPIQLLIAHLDQGRLAMTGISSNQVVGTASILNFYTGRESTNVIIYRDKELAGAKRHVFEVQSSPSSSFIIARVFVWEENGGVTFQAEEGGGFFRFNAGIRFDYQFTAPIYRPPPTPSSNVAVRVEAISKQWIAPPDAFMHITANSLLRVK